MEGFSSGGISKREKVERLVDLFKLSEAEALRLLEQHNEDYQQAVTYMGTRGQQRANEVADGGVADSDIAPAAVGGSMYAVDSVTGTEQDPIDLTKDGNDQDMQKALMLSMQDLQGTTGGGVLSLEEQELSRALEASLRETGVSGLSKPMMALFQDPKNPHKRKRIGKTPVGLKNIGNTCWFSAVIQSLYHIPAFRHHILSYSPPPLLPNGLPSHPQCVLFVLELQKIFALMHKSNKMYIDPSLAIQSLQETFSKGHSHTGAQQDVSEFTHKLLEWIENAFKLSLASNPSESGNPVVKLFNGHYKTEGINNDTPFISESDFGAYPIQVRGHAHLHDSLESATFDTEMQQQTFFTRFPPILVLELSRFQYNQTTSQVEKVHDLLDFDPVLYVDRYLEENKEESCRRKRDVDQLRKKINELDTRLEWYMSYRQKPIPITDVLSLTLAFVRDDHVWEQGTQGAEQAEKRPRTSLYPTPRYKTERELETLEACLSRWKEELAQDIEDLQASIKASKASLDVVYSDPSMNLTPYQLHAVMVHQGEAYGGHYWTYIRKHSALSIPPPSTTAGQAQETGEGALESGHGNEGVSGSGSSTSMVTQDGKTNYRTQLETGEMYADTTESMVSVNAEVSTCGSRTSQDCCAGAARGEGMEVERCGGEEVWLKFNDVSVCEVSWDEVRRESVGSSTGGNTSAYCLVYINRLLHEDWLNNYATPPSLSEELEKYVEEDNTCFLKELIEHDRNIQTASHISDVTVGSEGCPPSPLGAIMSPSVSASAAPESALPAGPRQGERSPQELMQIDSPPALPVSPTLQTQLNKLISSHNYHNLQLTKEHDEPRPLNLSVYASLSDYPKPVVRLVALDAIIHTQTDEKVKMLARREYIQDLSVVTRENRTNPVDALKRDFHNFVSVCWFFVQAMKMSVNKNFSETLMLCLKASHLHKAIQSHSAAHLQTAHLDLLHYLKYKSLEEVSNKGYRMFEKGEVRDGIQIANTLVVPALAQLSRESGRHEEAVLEKVREEWCQCLNRPGLDESEQDQLGDLLTRILDDSGKTPSIPNICGQEVDLDSLDHLTLVTDLTLYIRRLTQQQQNLDSFLGI